MIKTDQTIDRLANGSAVKAHYRVEAKFHGKNHAPGWRRNQQEQHSKLCGGYAPQELLTIGMW